MIVWHYIPNLVAATKVAAALVDAGAKSIELCGAFGGRPWRRKSPERHRLKSRGLRCFQQSRWRKWLKPSLCHRPHRVRTSSRLGVTAIDHS